jgi:aconitate hydratase
MSTVLPSLAGPKRPQDRVLLTDMPSASRAAIGQLTAARDKRSSEVADFISEGGGAAVGNEQHGKGQADIVIDGKHVRIKDGAVVIAAITSCTNTSNPAVMVAAGLLARNAAARGLTRKPWVKTSLAPGSRVVTDYLQRAGLLAELEKIGFYTVGYGCTTCIGNSGPLPVDVSAGIAAGDLCVASVLSGNRNFEGRIHAEVKMNYLASPPLVVAYALAGSTEIDIAKDPLGTDAQGAPVYLKDLWPSNQDIHTTILATLGPDMFKQNYADVFKGDARWNAIASPDGELYAWNAQSTYIKNPPYFDGMTMEVGRIDDISGARVLGYFGDSITTDHISPAGSIKKDSPAGRYLIARGVAPQDFNSYGSRRGNDDVMVRGTFANIRIKNLFFDGEEGGNTLYFGAQPPEKMAIFDAAMHYKTDATPLLVIAGKEYGTGSSRDWAAKGTLLLGVKAVIAESFERIHRSNLVGMGVLPLQFRTGQNAASLGLDGHETYAVAGLADGAAKTARVTATRADGRVITFDVDVLLLTPKEVEYARHGGVLQYVLRQLASKK